MIHAQNINAEPAYQTQHGGAPKYEYERPPLFCILGSSTSCCVKSNPMALLNTFLRLATKSRNSADLDGYSISPLFDGEVDKGFHLVHAGDCPYLSPQKYAQRL